MNGEWDWDQPEPDYEEPEFVRDPKVDEAKDHLLAFFRRRPTDVFDERQLEVIFEGEFFHWITWKALYELRGEGLVASDLLRLNPGEDAVPIRLYRSPASYRYWKRQAREVIRLVHSFSQDSFTRALGRQGELLFDAALPTAGFMPKAQKVRAYAGREWTLTGHDLDRVFERDGTPYGLEIKNTLPYIPHGELRIKIQICQHLGLRPLFIVRMAPKSYVEEVRRLGGFTLIFKYQLYPYGFAELAAEVRRRLQLPTDSPAQIAQGTIQRFLNWHLKQPSA